MRHVKLLLLALTLPALLLCGCSNRTELDRWAVVQAVGIDLGESCEVTVQYYHSENSDSGIDPAKPNTHTCSGRGKTLSAAIEAASLDCGRPLLFGEGRVIVLGGELTTDAVTDCMRELLTMHRCEPQLLLAATRGESAEVMAVKFDEGNISAEHLRTILESAAKAQIAEEAPLFGSLRALMGRNTIQLPLVTVTQGGTDLTEDGKNVAVSGVFTIIA